MQSDCSTIGEASGKRYSGENHAQFDEGADKKALAAAL